jgi:hypothetical protein
MWRSQNSQQFPFRVGGYRTYQFLAEKFPPDVYCVRAASRVPSLAAIYRLGLCERARLPSSALDMPTVPLPKALMRLQVWPLGYRAREQTASMLPFRETLVGPGISDLFRMQFDD